MKYILTALLLWGLQGAAQCKSYKLSRNGDTLNCTDMNDLKQGRWVIKVEGVRGEPGFDEEGVFKNGKKEGYWRVYTAMGDLYAVERYRWGQKDGVSQYFNITGLAREESWKSTNPDNPYDTIEVPDLTDPYKVEMKVIKLEGSAVKHGTWKYYESGTGSLLKSEKYFLDKKEDPASMIIPLDTVANDSMPGVKKPLATKAKPQAVLDFEKKNSGKKKVKVIDGRTF